VQVVGVGGGGAHWFCCGLQIDNLAFPKVWIITSTSYILHYALCEEWMIIN
jgi:hypothetical protein